ncbi:hypothetical protein D3C79_546770 [compost metagenome]
MTVVLRLLGAAPDVPHVQTNQQGWQGIAQVLPHPGFGAHQVIFGTGHFQLRQHLRLPQVDEPAVNQSQRGIQACAARRFGDDLVRPFEEQLFQLFFMGLQ